MSAIKLGPRLAIAILLTTGAAVAAAVDCTGTRGTGLEVPPLWQAAWRTRDSICAHQDYRSRNEDKTRIELSRKVERDR